ncbi:RNA-binding protein Ro60-like [Schistocerca gregaria]|uniref:RNA-binding protein Ro60-like n=1 Tax=Schistocerca gregaria TaxID=7010 RepID=UPI00211DFDA2|nr:RNA-binding protein Ro60-like [Schistocerca gregaria]XP_049844124.1 RNA-binding protein Ro60-like [Schistocerca gregaria]XP_049844125.1 RNA-binding protein Ro60-like [Schistocerca gregaria]XP_049844126.1 RNA-binding protein Ro60-like [Schistocerca gregaria]
MIVTNLTEKMAVSAETRLKRFLHYGSELPCYEAGAWKINIASPNYEAVELTSVDSLISEGKGSDVVKHIIEAYNGGYSAEPEAILFALVLCMKQSQSLEVRRAAYAAIETVYKTPKSFFAFVKYITDLSKPTTGWGRGLRRAVNNWYLHQEPQKMAENVTRFVGMHSWTHKDILKLAHTCSKNPAQNAVISYVINGIETAQKLFNDKPEAQSIIEYLKNVENLKHSTNSTTASLLISAHSFSFECVPSGLYRSKEIWHVLIPKMSVVTILKVLRRLSRYRLLRRKSVIVPLIVDRLKEEQAIIEEKVQPAEILLYLKKYESSSRLRFIDRSRPVKPPPPVNPAVVDAANALLNTSVSLLKPTGLRYIIAVNNGFDMILTKCWQCRELTCCMAALLITYCIYKTETDATVLIYSASDMEEVPLDKSLSFNETISTMRARCSAAKVNMAQPVMWAQKNKKAVDVFVVITNNNNETSSASLPTCLNQYRTEMNLPQTKYIAVGLDMCGLNCIDPADPGMLEIKGFDEKVPTIIEAFSRGAF